MYWWSMWSVTNNRSTAAVNILTFRLFLGYSNYQNVGEEGRRHARALLLHTLNAKYNTCQFLEVNYIHQLAGYARNYVTITKQEYWLRWSDPHLRAWLVSCMRLGQAPKMPHLYTYACLVAQPGSCGASFSCLDDCICSSTCLKQCKSGKQTLLIGYEVHPRFSGAWLARACSSWTRPRRYEPGRLMRETNHALSSWPQRLQVDDTWLEGHYT